jgi:hypothetical protein
MRLAFNHRKNRVGHRLSAAWLPLAMAVAAVVSLGSAANATDYNGGFSNTGLAPTPVSFSLGDNIVSGVTGGFDSNYMTFTIAPGEDLSSITVLDGSPSPDRIFFGVASGDTVVVDPSFTSAAGLIGWTLFSDAQDHTNVLGALGLAAPANFPAIPGATGFTPPLGAGTYSTWIVDGDGGFDTVKYKLDFAVSSAPEPSTWLLMFLGVGLVGGALRLGSRRLAPA